MRKESNEPLSRKLFRYRSLRIGVSTDDPSHVEWLAEFLAPQFQVADRGPADCEVTLLSDRRRHEELLEHGPAGAQVECFALDSKVLRYPLWNSDSQYRLVFDETHRVFYSVGPGSKEIRILSHKNRLGSRTPLMRVVRELAMNHSQYEGGVFLHASSFVVGERGVLIAGPKGAGKTTLLIHALQAPSANHLSNDRVLVWWDGEVPKLRGMPSIVTVRQRTFDFFPDLRNRLLSDGYHSRLSLREAEEGLHPQAQPWSDGRYGLTPAQFCALLGAESVAEVQARTLLFPRITDARVPLRLEAISAGDAADRLTHSLFGVGNLRTTSPLFNLSTDQPPFDAGRLKAQCLKLASSIDCFVCMVGRDVSESKAMTKILNGRLAADQARRVIGRRAV